MTQRRTVTLCSQTPAHREERIAVTPEPPPLRAV